MADNGKIIRNGAEIQIDENGNVVARPAAGQELIVEDDARVGTLEAEQLNTVRFADQFDGADGGEQIQNAIDDLPAEGGMVFVPSEGPDQNGRWDVSSKIVPDSNTTLKGVPGATRLYAADGLDDDVIQTRNSSNYDPGDPKENIHIHGFVIDGNSSGQTIRDAPNQAYGLAGVRLDNVVGGTVKHIIGRDLGDVDTRDPRGYSVEIKCSHNIIVEKCEAYQCGDDGISVTNAGRDTDDGSNIVVRDCYAEGNEDAGFECDDGPYNVRFEDCTSVDNGNFGFDIHSHSGAEMPVNIHHTDCTAESNGQAGFALRHLDPDGATKDPKNYFYRNISSINNGEQGWRLTEDGVTPTVSNVVVEVDDIRDNGDPSQGIDISAEVDGLEIFGGEIVNNRYGIQINHASSGAESKNIRFHDLTIKGGTRSGIVFWNTGVIRNATVDSVVAVDNGQDAESGVRAAGIGINDQSDIIVSSCRCYDDGAGTQEFGIYRGDDYNLYAGNNLRGNTESAFGGSLGTNSEEGPNIQ